MKLLLGRLDGDKLAEIASSAATHCTRVQAAVAYAHDHEHPFFESIREREGIHLTFFGLLDESGAVGIPLLRALLAWGADRVTVRLVKGNFHPKVIRWRGVGAYVGSANLTQKGWFENVEAGVFLEEAELEKDGTAEKLDQMFAQLDAISLPVDVELLAKLEQLDNQRRSDAERLAKLLAAFDALFGEAEPPTPTQPESPALVGEQDELECEVGFFIQSPGVQHMLVVPAAHSDEVSAFTGKDPVSALQVSWNGGSYISSTTFTRQHRNNEWKMTISKKQKEASPLFDFALRTGAGDRFSATFSKTREGISVKLGIDTVPQASRR